MTSRVKKTISNSGVVDEKSREFQAAGRYWAGIGIAFLVTAERPLLGLAFRGVGF
jgi:hypothetical protein